MKMLGATKKTATAQQEPTVSAISRSLVDARVHPED
jgi:hypothetical protein